jgi:hypothetical protein
MAWRRPNESPSRSSLDLLAELPNLHAVHGCALLLVGQLSVCRRFKLAIAIGILIGAWIHALNVWNGILTPPWLLNVPRMWSYTPRKGGHGADSKSSEVFLNSIWKWIQVANQTVKVDEANRSTTGSGLTH